MSQPTAIYTANGVSKTFVVGSGPHLTAGSTTGPSPAVLAAGGVDRDAPAAASDSAMGTLRAELTTLQDQLNGYLTARMQGDGGDVERRVLDEGVDEDSDEA